MTRVALMTAAVCVLLAATANAASRYALVVGANHGDPSDGALRFAESDARKLAEVLRTAGMFAPKDVTVLTDVSATDVRRALIELNARIRQDNDGSMLLVFYSGHADGTSLHLGGSRLAMDEFRDLVAGSSAATRLLVIDACQSGALTRIKGGKAAPSFTTQPPALPVAARGLAILASSAGQEDAQESDELKGSFFTHYFVSALRGAADENRDGRITLSEAYAYTSERTLAATSGSREGPQHPTYRFDLGGHDELVLTQLAASGRLGFLTFDTPGEYFIKEADEGGALVAELALKKGETRQVIVPEGSYYISRRSSDHLLQGSFAVKRGVPTRVATTDMKRVEYARVVRKGGTAETRALSAYTVAGVRGSLLGIGMGWNAGVGARVDLSALSLELRVQGGYATKDNDRITIGTRELGSSAIGLRAFDLGHVTMGLGIELGGFWLAQHFADPQSPDRNTFGAVLGPIGIMEVPLGRWYVRAELAALTYILRAGNDAQMSEVDTPLTFRTALGAGAYF
jgi:hypothetical protein